MFKLKVIKFENCKFLLYGISKIDLKNTHFRTYYTYASQLNFITTPKGIKLTLFMYYGHLFSKNMHLRQVIGTP